MCKKDTRARERRSRKISLNLFPKIRTFFTKEGSASTPALILSKISLIEGAIFLFLDLYLEKDLCFVLSPL